MAFQDRIEVLIESIFDKSGFEQFERRVKSLRKRAQSMDSAFGNIQGMTGGRGGGPGGIAEAGFSDRVKESNAAMEEARNMTTPLTQQTRGLRDVFRNVGFRIRNAADNLSSWGDSAENSKSSARGFRFELLGLMFAGMALKKAMFGLLRPAFEAAGVFDLIGSILEFMFLPVALDVLNFILDIQDNFFGLGEETRRLIGWLVAAAGALGTIAFIGGQAGLAMDSLLIFLGKGSTAAKLVLGPMRSLAQVLVTMSGLSTSGLITTLQGFAGAAASKLAALASTLSTVATVAAGFIAGFAIVDKTFKKFGDTIGTIMTAILVTVGAVVAFVASAPLIIVGAIALAIGAIAAFIWNFRDEIWNAITSVIDIIGQLVNAGIDLFWGFVNGFVNIVGGAIKWVVNAFKGLYDTLVGNSIIPDIVNETIGFFKDLLVWFSNLPVKFLKFALTMGEKIINGIVQGIKNAPNAIMNALEGILPGWAVDILRKGANQVAGVVDSSGNVIGGTMNTISNVGNNLGNSLSNLGRGGGGNTRFVVNQNIDARSRNPDESPQSRARRVGREARRGSRSAFNRRAGGR